MTASRAGGVQSDGGYTVTVTTAAGEVALRAAAAKRLNKLLTIQDVTDDMRALGVVVLVDPEKASFERSSTKISVAAPIQHVVLQSESNIETVAWPERVDTEPVELSNLLAGKVQGNRAVARFTFDALRGLPVGNFDVVVITREGERRCKVARRDRAKLDVSVR